ncbi:trans-L-3-hydroxyproline dehydratase-like isoform X2 [Argiope bruennichi]|uniref:trans-L-3-hydroxyproline dehydratase-like isoform X2 n=1 Tax=Argiope bruennichi TaxID=94029 RepID=UPI00249525A1|nr:trans-L-3-hydroxyproline dehydratase-like isoform X2 [Argiope bruennichi]
MSEGDFMHVIKVTTHDMHTGGEPLRIITSGLPDLKGSTILEKRVYAKQHLDHYRRLLMNEPRGHKDMYGAILFQEKPNEFGVLFLNNEGYSPMCGHGVIALGRYVVDYGLVKPVSPETEITFNCPCGPVQTYVEYNNNSSGSVHFESVPAFVYKLGAEIVVPKIGKVLIDVAYGGAFYAIISDKDVSLDLKSTPLTEIIDVAGRITEAVKKQLLILHPEREELSFLYGTIITDGKDKFTDGTTTNICIFADKEVDRSPTGSGVTARMALQWKKGFISKNEIKEFKSVIGTTFTGRIIDETTVGDFPAVIVEVSEIRREALVTILSSHMLHVMKFQKEN